MDELPRTRLDERCADSWRHEYIVEVTIAALANRAVN
jgi:hypothetical protein